jgi:LCP family protein required for cell wall assembly
MISIPRDLVTPVSNWEKVNSIDSYAEAKNPGSGGAATAQAISQLFQIPIQYYVRVDFQGFVNIINELGGIQVNVENTLDDYSYPIIGQEDNPDYYARFKHLHVDKGLQNMDGELALEYSRSRHAAGSEGSDFARARRQQLVLEAVKTKLLSAQTLLNPVTISKLVSEVNKNISTNLNSWEILRVWELFKDVDRSQIINKVFSDAPDGFLISGRGQDGAYILTPRSGNFTQMRNFVSDIFTVGTSTPATTSSSPNSYSSPVVTITDHATVLVMNGTWISGLASKTTVFLEQAGFKILKITNASARDYKTSVVYDLTGGKKSSSLAALRKITGAVSATDSPGWLKTYQPVSSTATTSDLVAQASASTTPVLQATSTLNATSSILTSSATSSQRATLPTTASVAPNFILILGTDAN